MKQVEGGFVVFTPRSMPSCLYGPIYPAALMECGLVLMGVTLIINILALLLVRSVAPETI